MKKPKKKVLFVCKHNMFRSRVAEEFFNKYNKNNKWIADSAGIIRWDSKNLKKDKEYIAERTAAKEAGINIYPKPRSLDSSLLNHTKVVIIVANDVPRVVFNDKSFNGKVKIWKIRDVLPKDKNKLASARKSVEEIKKKIIKFVENLR